MYKNTPASKSEKILHTIVYKVTKVEKYKRNNDKPKRNKDGQD